MRRKSRMQDLQQPDQALSPITGTLAVDVFGVGARAIVLAGRLLNSLVRNSEIRCERSFPRYQQKCQQNGRLPRISTCVFNES